MTIMVMMRKILHGCLGCLRNDLLEWEWVLEEEEEVWEGEGQ